MPIPASDIQPDFFAEAYRGCQEAYLDEVGTGYSTVQLHFGGEEANVIPGQDGTITIRPYSYPFTFSNIAQYTSSFAAGYEQCASNLLAQGGYLPSTSIDIVVSNDLLDTTSSDYQSVDQRLGSEMATQALAQTLNGYNYLTSGKALAGVVTFDIGVDMEQSYSIPSAALSWIQGVQQGLTSVPDVSQTTPDFFGSSNCTATQECLNGWSPQLQEQAAFANGTLAMPQIYYQSDATEWASLTQQAIYTYSYTGINFGVTAAEDLPIPPISADSAWTIYWQQLNKVSSLEPAYYSGFSYITDYCTNIGPGVCETPAQYCSLTPQPSNCGYLNIVTAVENADPPNDVFTSSSGPSKAPKMIQPSLYVTDFANGTLEEVDTTTGATQALQLGSHGSLTSIKHIIGNEFIAVDTTHNQVIIINNGTEIKAIPVGSRPTDVAVGFYRGQRYALVTDTGSNEVTPIDLNTLVALKPIPVGSAPFGIAVSQNNDTAYVCDIGSNEITPINLSTLSSGAPITNVKSPIEIALSRDGKLALVTDFNSNQVTPINLKTMQVLSPITVGSHPIGIAISPDSSLAYVANFGSSTISEINLMTLTVQSQVNVESEPMSIALVGDNTIYVTLFSTGSIAELTNIGNKSLNLVKTIHVGPEPIGIAAIHGASAINK